MQFPNDLAQAAVAAWWFFTSHNGWPEDTHLWFTMCVLVGAD
jgi:hypothetical protein